MNSKEIEMCWRAVLLASALLSAATAEASAVENFIPRGHSYAPGEGQLPPLNSERDQLNNQTDSLQSEIYVKEFQRKQLDSELSRFINEQNLAEPDYLPRY
jgi:hypothetical protein